MTAEHKRLAANAANEVPLERWGPYLSERQWGTVREDYSSDGAAWDYFPHDHARSRVYRWGEDGIAGISDYGQNICFALALWNGNDPILKERLFGLTNSEGNHGEDVKELYYYVDNLPTHYYMKYLYKYPHAAYPYDELVRVNAERAREYPKTSPEYELLDTAAMTNGEYFDVTIEYAKGSSTDVYIRLTVVNRGESSAMLTLLPQLWLRNRWAYGGLATKPRIEANGTNTVKVTHEATGDYYLYYEAADDAFFTENETNTERLFGHSNPLTTDGRVKDAFHDAIIHGTNLEGLRTPAQGTKFAPVYRRNLKGGDTTTIYLRLTDDPKGALYAPTAAKVFALRQHEADEFYAAVCVKNAAAAQVQRQAYAGLLWSKQFYHLDIETWLSSDDGVNPWQPSRLEARNNGWKTLKNNDVIIMPDKWEYPWYAAWDTAFHCITMATIDATFAKHQLLLLLREWYMSPAGQIPAYEWNFSDVNPPVHAFAVWQVYSKEKAATNIGDVRFLKRAFQKLIINFTWWVNRKDANGNNVFEGGFLGLDNIGIFNRNIQLPSEVLLEQADGTSWMAMFALNMMEIAVEIAQTDDSFEDAATKFYEHFVLIADALHSLGIWNEADRFYYDVLSLRDTAPFSLKVRSIVGLTPLFAVANLPTAALEALPDFAKRMAWFTTYRTAASKYVPTLHSEARSDVAAQTLFAVVPRERLEALLEVLLSEAEFLSNGGIRALSKFHEAHPYTLHIDGAEYSIGYEPSDSVTGLFGGNSNWRGPVWMPINYLLLTSLRRLGSFYGNDLTAEYPTGSGQKMPLSDIVQALAARIASPFLPDAAGNRPIHHQNAAHAKFYAREENRELILFYEYLHGDTARGVGASHQTGWTALVAEVMG